jgi:SAM-dependent methyltransferase
MLARTAARARRHGADVTCVQADIRTHAPQQVFDAVCANHLLNVFAEHEAHHLFCHLANLVRPGGLVMVADFAPPRGLRDALLHLHWSATVVVGVLFRLCDLHRLYDYSTWLDDAGLVLTEERQFAVLGVLPAYRNLVLQKLQPPSSPRWSPPSGADGAVDRIG